jgi:5-methylcytosine-specific restriction enzyme A
MGSNTSRLQGRKAVERRKEFLAKHPLCVACEARGLVTQAEEVDHIVPLSKGGVDDRSNLQSLCKECHDEKTRDDLGWRMKPGADHNGMPLNPNHHWNKS